MNSTRFVRTMNSTRSSRNLYLLPRWFAVAAMALALLAGANVRGTDQYWTNSSGGTFSDANNWDAGAPGSTDQAFFTNAATYQVTLSATTTDYPLVVNNGAVTFNLNSYTWNVGNANNTLGSRIYSNANVTISSSAGGGTLNLGTGNNQYPIIAGKLQINDSLGSPVTVVLNDARVPLDGTYTNGITKGGQVVVSGSGTVFRMVNPYQMVWEGQVLVTNKALFEITTAYPAGNVFVGYKDNSSATGSLVVANAALHTTKGLDVNKGNGYGIVSLSDHATWTNDAGELIFGESSTSTAKFEMDQSSLVTPNLYIGGYWASTIPGRADVLNGSSITASKLLQVSAFSSQTNMLVLNDSTIKLGGGATAGALTNRGLIRANGTIEGLGSSRALVRSENLLEIGGSLGTLVLTNANLELAAGSKTLFEFSNTGLDSILINGGGVASMLGSNLFSLASGSTTPSGPGWGLGVYNFLVGSNLTYSPQSDNLVSLLTGYGLVQNTDYTYGVVDFGGGLQALQLSFPIPEPSAMLLVALGGWLVWRRRARR
ncbi:MAG: PEP-CTERM sorting domain-containing protein [Terrimicrobiaceae bacterium]